MTDVYSNARESAAQEAAHAALTVLPQEALDKVGRISVCLDEKTLPLAVTIYDKDGYELAAHHWLASVRIHTTITFSLYDDHYIGSVLRLTEYTWQQ